jgi:cytochrome b561
MSPPNGFSLAQIRLHWAVAALILFQIIFGDQIGHAWRAVKQGGTPQMTVLVWAHIGVGIAVLVLAIWRLVLRRKRGVPAAPAGLSKRAVLAGEVGHWALYALMIAAPVTGLAAWFGGVMAAGEVHEMLKPVIIILVLLHVAAALWHHFVRKDGLLLRMKKPLD